MDRSYRIFLIIGLLGWILFWIVSAALPAQAQNPNYLHTDGNLLLDSNGDRVVVTGISWFGLETENYAPHGLWARNLESFLDQIVELGFNTIRLPYSNQLFDPSSIPNGINYDLNPDLVGLNGLEIMDKLITGAGARGLKVILDRHRPDSHAQSELWYTAQYSEERWIDDWVMLAKRYSGNDTVIGADLHNEPHGKATWGTGDPATDWSLAAERAGNAILAVNPNWLIIVQGVEQYQGEFYWWGGNLMGVREHPVRLNVPDRLVYSPHTYGPGVYPQTWFSDPSFPDNMPGIWDRHWGYVHKEGLAPVILGEFGGRSVENDREGVWQRALVSYLRENEISYLYWTLNPNSGDTGGILLDDWQTIDPSKQALLSSYQFPMIGSGQGVTEHASTVLPATPQPTSAASATAPPPSPPPPLLVGSGLRVRYHTSNPAELSSDSKPELIIVNTSQVPVRLEDLELIYWFTDDPGRTYAFQCDWAQIGCEKVLGEFEALSNGVYALHLRFQSGSGELLPGQESGEIKVRFNRADWSEIRQFDDYSFSATSDYIDWDRVTLYLSSKLVWGREPGSFATNSPPVAGTILSTPSPTGIAQSGMSAETQIPEKPTAEPSPPSSSPIDVAPNPNWGLWLGIVLAAFVAGFLIAAIWIIRRNR